MRVFLALALALALSSARGATFVAASTSLANVTTAYNLTSSAGGDTVSIPAGSSTWSSALTITHGVILQGAGRASTIITSSGGTALIQITPGSTAITDEHLISILDTKFDGGNSSLILINVDGAAASSAKAFKNLVIGNCTLQNNSTTTSGNGTIAIGGQVRGCIYGNIFDRCNVILKNLGNDDTTEWANGHFPFAYGNADNLFFEGNTIQYSSSYSGEDPGWMESGQGARLVCRYNSWNLANATQQELWDVHGFQNWPGGQTGTMLVEYYGNTASNCGGSRWINHRGSWGLYHNNIITGSGGMGIDINQYQAGDTGGSGCTADVSGASGVYVCEVNNTYVFNNTLGGTIEPMGQGAIGNGCGVTENNGYWNYNASFTGATGIGRGTSTPSSSCTVGVAYWKASTATPTTDSSVIQAGHLYKCLSTDVWTDYYTPYTYPHPLQGQTAIATQVRNRKPAAGIRRR